MTVVKIRIINQSENPLPAYATEGSSGMDLRASMVQSIELGPMERCLVPTGIFLEIPEGYEGQVRPRSGLALKQGITCLNSPGTIDADYRGELKVILINLSGEKQVLLNGDRIAQLVIQKVEKCLWIPSVSINETQRNEGGFGHTGKN
jgi:dUTP pyrophosphatase